jgi:hypothetical protein
VVSLQRAFPWGEEVPGGVLARAGGLDWWRGLPAEVRRVASRAAHSPTVKLRKRGRGVELVGPVSLVSLRTCPEAFQRWSHQGRTCWEWQPPAAPRARKAPSSGPEAPREDLERAPVARELAR